MLAIEDIMIRHKRMQGYSALWIPGTDHASIATQNKVEKLIAEEGETRHSMGRERSFGKICTSLSRSRAPPSATRSGKWAPAATGPASATLLTPAYIEAVREIFVRKFSTTA